MSLDAALYLAWIILVIGLVSIRLLVPGMLLERKDKRTLNEKNWDWIMGDELPSTCSVAGHTYQIDPFECDWCHAQRWVTVHGTRREEDLTTYWDCHGIRAQFVTDQLEDYALMGQREHVLVMPATATVVDAYTNEQLGPAGIVFDSKPSNLRSSGHEAREEAKAQAARAAKRDAAGRYDTPRWLARHEKAKATSRHETGSYPRGSQLEVAMMQKRLEAKYQASLEQLFKMGHVSPLEMRDRMRWNTKERRWDY